MGPMGVKDPPRVGPSLCHPGLPWVLRDPRLTRTLPPRVGCRAGAVCVGSRVRCGTSFLGPALAAVPSPHERRAHTLKVSVSLGLTVLSRPPFCSEHEARLFLSPGAKPGRLLHRAI